MMAIRHVQPRPDLDAAVDAVLPSLTAVSEDAAAASLRRSRAALADAAPGREGVGAWRWSVAAAAAALIGLASLLALWHSPAPEPGSAVERRPASPVIVTAPLAPSTPAVAPVPGVPRPFASAATTPRGSGRGPGVPVQATSVPTTPTSSRPDPLIALVRAVQRIPEEAWQRSATIAAEPVSVPDVSFSPIDVAPLETPPIADASVEPLAPGEP